jgi:hypothetical protein
MDTVENWLHGEQIECPACHQALYRVDHSPMYDEVFLYCDRCPIHVEVSYYDPVYERVTREHPPDDGWTLWMRALEAQLKPCSCGGTFRHDAARRCLACHAPVIVDHPSGIDLYFWSDVFLPDDSNLSDDLVEADGRRHEPFVRTHDLWKDA